MTSQEFYFVRHGQTDHNVLAGVHKGDHPGEVPLNDYGRMQAKQIVPIIGSLPIQHVCSSPLKRAIETKEIITENLLMAQHYQIPELTECSAEIWRSLVRLGRGEPLVEGEAVSDFIAMVKLGLDRVLSLNGTVLIVAHGGIHLALCWLLEVHEHDWVVDNCVVVHFKQLDDGRWVAKRLLNDVKQIS